MSPAEYAAMLLWAVEPTDRALAGWGDGQHEHAASWLTIEATGQDARDQVPA